MDDGLLTVDEAATLMLIDRQTVERWFSEGLPTVEQGGERLIRRADLDAYLRSIGQGMTRDPARED